MAKRSMFLLAALLWGCSEPKPRPNVVRPPPGAPRPLTIAGPMPHFGPFTNVSDAIGAACPFILSQPHAVIPTRKGDQNFDVYWRTAEEYCAWIYGVEGRAVEMSLLSMSSVQSNPKARHCDLPPYVADSRYPADSISYLVIIHSHPFDKELSQQDPVATWSRHRLTIELESGVRPDLARSNGMLTEHILSNDSGGWPVRVVGPPVLFGELLI